MMRRTLVCTVLIAACGPVASAQAAGTLRGSVTVLRAGTPVGDYRVNLYDTAQARVTTSVCTAPDGTYAFTNLAAGSYKVHFAGGAAAGCTASTLAPQWFRDRFSFQFAEAVTVAEDAVVAGIDGRLPDGASVLGRVTAQDGGAALANVRVKVLDLNGETMRDGCSAADGTYRIDGLVPGALLVGFFPDQSCGPVDGELRTQYYKDADTANAALSVNASEGTVSTNVDAHLKRTAAPPVTRRLTVTVSGQGTVTSAPGGIACGGTCVADFADGAAVDLVATPAAGMAFSGWSGACAGALGCSARMDADRTVGARFTPVGGGGGSATPATTPTATATPTPAPTVTPPGAAPPKVSVSRVKLSRTGTLSLRVSEPATLSAKVERRVGKRWRKVKAVTFTAKRAGAVKVALKLKAAGRHRVTVTPTARGAKGVAVTVTAQIRKAAR